MWQQSETPFTCSIGAPKKGSKFGGMKSFIAYQVTPSFSNIQVSRRYKHFDWLYERLNGKFGAVVAIPPLPDKQVTGRFEEDLIEHRWNPMFDINIFKKKSLKLFSGGLNSRASLIEYVDIPC